MYLVFKDYVTTTTFLDGPFSFLSFLTIKGQEEKTFDSRQIIPIYSHKRVMASQEKGKISVLLAALYPRIALSSRLVVLLFKSR